MSAINPLYQARICGKHRPDETREDRLIRKPSRIARETFLLEASAKPSSPYKQRVFSALFNPPKASFPLPLRVTEPFSDKGNKVLDLPGICPDKSLQLFHSSEELLAIALDDCIYLYDTNLFAVKGQPIQTSRISAIALKADKKYLAVAQVAGGMEAYSLDSQTLVWKTDAAATLQLSQDEISRMVFGEKFIYAIGQSGTLYQIDAKTGHLTASLKLSQTPLVSIAASLDQRYMAIGNQAGSIKIYEMNHLELIKKIEATGAIEAIAFDPSGAPRIAFSHTSANPQLSIHKFGGEPFKIDLPLALPATTLEWYEKGRLISTHPDGSYKVLPVGQNAVGEALTIAVRREEILFSRIFNGFLGIVFPSESLHLIPIPKRFQSKPAVKPMAPLMLSGGPTIR